jgi:hypothetical protein
MEIKKAGLLLLFYVKWNGNYNPNSTPRFTEATLPPSILIPW